MKSFIRKLISLCLSFLLLSGCSPDVPKKVTSFSAGFSSQALSLDSLNNYYIAGYQNGKHPEGILDDLRASALWLDNGVTSLLIISVDCIGLSSATVNRIREALQDFCEQTGSVSINVVSTHTHAGVDTLGLWGPVGLNGKHEPFIEQLIDTCVTVSQAAYHNRSQGQLYYGAIQTEDIQEDSRYPYNYDSNLYQLRFVPNGNANAGIRVLSYAAHAESLRSENMMISRDYPGQLCEIIGKKTGDHVLFLPGAVGGLIMTREMDDDRITNLQITGQKLAEYALAIQDEHPLSPDIFVHRQKWETPMENTLFIYYKFLGVLENSVRKDMTGTYWLQTELTIVTLGDVALALIPGEIFPELVSGTDNAKDPPALSSIAAQHGISNLLVIGLANDEIGYIIPPSDFLLSEEAPYVIAADNHYEETNSLGPYCAKDLAEAFDEALRNLR